MRTVTRALAQFWEYARAVFGETAYDDYVAHHRQHCPTGPVMTRREFEQVKHKPNIRCC